MTSCDEVRVHLGGYVLEGLDPDEMRRVEDHARSCPVCAEELADLAELPRLLALTVEESPSPPPALRNRVVASLARERADRRRTLGLVAAALVIGLVLGGGAATLVGQLGGEPPDSAVVGLHAGREFSVDGRASFTPIDDVVVVTVRLDGLPALPAPGVYEAWVAEPDAEPSSIGRFDRDEDGSATVEFTVDGPLDRWATFWVTAEPDAADPSHEGATVVYGPVPQLERR